MSTRPLVEVLISIHAPRGGSDIFLLAAHRSCHYFNPRSPWGERLALMPKSANVQHISIHAPRGGSDEGNALTNGQSKNFNPRSPWGERLPCPRTLSMYAEFQSTLPVGGATIKSNSPVSDMIFQSTLPVGGATSP